MTFHTLIDVRKLLTYNGDDAVGNFSVSGDWLAAHSLPTDADIGFSSVNGHCMEPTLSDGSRIAFAREERSRDALRKGGVFIFVSRGRVQVKRMRIVRDNLHIIQDKWPAASAVMAKSNMMFYKILGRVFWTGSDAEIGRTICHLEAPAEVRRICA